MIHNFKILPFLLVVLLLSSCDSIVSKKETVAKEKAVLVLVVDTAMTTAKRTQAKNISRALWEKFSEKFAEDSQFILYQVEENHGGVTSRIGHWSLDGDEVGYSSKRSNIGNTIEKLSVGFRPTELFRSIQNIARFEGEVTHLYFLGNVIQKGSQYDFVQCQREKPRGSNLGTTYNLAVAKERLPRVSSLIKQGQFLKLKEVKMLTFASNINYQGNCQATGVLFDEQSEYWKGFFGNEVDVTTIPQ